MQSDFDPDKASSISARFLEPINGFLESRPMRRIVAELAAASKMEAADDVSIEQSKRAARYAAKPNG